MSQELSDRITHLEMLLSDSHPDEKNFVDSLRMKFASPEKRAAQAKKAEELTKNPPQMSSAASLSLADALLRINELEERERKRNLAQELAKQPPAPPPVR